MKKREKGHPSQKSLCNLKQLAEKLGISYYAARGFKKAGVLPQTKVYDPVKCFNLLAGSPVVPWHYMKKGSKEKPIDPKWIGRQPKIEDLVK